MSAIERALNAIDFSLNHPTVWAKTSVIISGLALLATVVVIIYNHKSITMAQKSIKQAVNLQLYEKRLELFNRLSDDDAFANVPLELKIVFSEQVYAMYKELSELCRMRWQKIDEYLGLCMVFGPQLTISTDPFYNLCQEKMSYIDKDLEQRIQHFKHTTDCQHHADALTKHRDDIQKLTGKICDKLPALEKEMEQIVKNSIGIEG